MWLPLAEWWYNTSFHTSLGTTPFEVVYGQAPGLHIPYVMGDSNVAAVDRSLAAREECLKLLKFHLQRAQDRMKSQADKHRTDVTLEEGDLVYIKLQPYRQVSVAYRSCNKLAPRYFGPFPIIAKIGTVAYKLKLPESSKIHPVFHVSQLKKHVGDAPVSSTLPELDTLGQLRVEPIAILDRKIAKRGNRVVVYVLVHWSNATPADATWELFDDVEKRFPEFNMTA